MLILKKRLDVEISIVRCFGGDEGEGLRLCIKEKGSRLKLIEATIVGDSNVANLMTMRECDGVAFVSEKG